MTESNKILTVSYGTFSCTLEGFDDPFGTMRGIAEYFRDLAAEDRYFGAEPPTPDVEMLQNIAQRDVQRRVEARIGESGVALRAADAVEDAELSEPAPAPAPAPATDAAPEAADVEIEVSDTAPLAFDDDYLMADEPEDAFVLDDSAPQDAGPAPESIAEKLRRIRAVVSRNIDTGGDDTTPFSDADGGSAFDAPVEKRDRALSETIRSISADLSDDDDIDALNPADPMPSDEPVALYPDEDDVETAEAEAETDVEDQLPDESADEDMEDDVLAEAAPDAPTETPEPIEADASDEDGADESDDYGYDEDYDDEDEVEEDRDDEDEDDQASILAGVLAATASDTTAPQPDAEASVDTDDTDDEADAQDDEEDADGQARASGEKAAHLEPLSDTNGNVGRLLKETDEKFAEDDGIRRRRVISQMRAAVAATKAERVLSKPVSPDQRAKEEQSPYRRDLTQVMPNEISANTAEAPSTQDDEPEAEVAPQVSEAPKVAPLVLVSSQRVDEAPAKTVTPHRPLKAAETEEASFAAFAEEMGAEELPDLLEAAAAFSAFVENQPHFSRPDIMKRVARVDPALSLSREAGLRSFGMLLRQGKIQKLQRGQFTIAEDTRFNPAHRIAGQ